MKKTGLFLAPLVALLALLAEGCSSGGPYDISGTVRFQGRPVPIGLVVIEPDAAKGNLGTQTQALIQDGSFRTLPGHGAIAGPVLISVSANDGVPQPLWPAGKLLFRTYQFQCDLPERASSLDIEVPPDYALPSQDADEQP